MGTLPCLSSLVVLSHRANAWEEGISYFIHLPTTQTESTSLPADPPPTSSMDHASASRHGRNATRRSQALTSTRIGPIMSGHHHLLSQRVACQSSRHHGALDIVFNLELSARSHPSLHQSTTARHAAPELWFLETRSRSPCTSPARQHHLGRTYPTTTSSPTVVA